MRVLVPDYRLAPEHPFPAALEDAVSVLRHLRVKGLSVAVGGDSAGANLAAAAIQSSPDLRTTAAWMISPYLDLTHTGGSVATRAELDPFVDPATMPVTAATYLAGADPADSRASPLFGDVAAFPPALIQVGSDEVLFEDARRFADRLPNAVFQEWVGMIHAWPLFPVEEGDWAIAQGAAFVRRMLKG
jgi:acetyl esterase/lipase